MTVIAWKDGIIAADRCASTGVLKVPAKKLIRHGNSVLATCGPVDFGAALVNWFKDGCKHETWPECQKRDDYSILVVANSNGVFLYYQLPVYVDRTRPYGAVGDGAQLAIGAMAAGASATQAVEIANLHCASCGFGVDSETFQ
jgi:hypothetical protein